MGTNTERSEQAVVLAVEDDPAMLSAYLQILNEAGFEVLTATNGKEAFELFISETPDLILSNITMPIMDGLELLKTIRESPQGKVTPFVFQTARGTREDIFKAKLLGADDYITKPITSRELIIAVQARIKRFNEFKEGLL